MNKYLLLFVCIASCTSAKPKKDQKQDTLFLQRVINDSSYWVVFIDTTGRSEFYERVSDYSFGQFDTATFQRSLDYLKEQKLKLEEKKIENLPRNWILMQQYKGKICAYSPCDYWNHYKIHITDTAWIDFSGEGPEASRISQYQQLDNKTFRFELQSAFPKKRELIIHTIDPSKGLAVFEDIRPDRHDFYLMADAARIRKFPIIVNYSRYSKVPELDFDRLDYWALIK